MPLFDSTTGQVQHGLYCQGCRIKFEEDPGSNRENKPVRWRLHKVYSRQEYLDHFPHCPQSIRLWQASKGSAAVEATSPAKTTQADQGTNTDSAKDQAQTDQGTNTDSAEVQNASG